MLWRIPADLHEQRIGVMGIFFPVILSAAKDLIAACHGHEILRYAQDDNSRHPLAGDQGFGHQGFAAPPMAKMGSGNLRKPVSAISATCPVVCRRCRHSRPLQASCAPQTAQSGYSPDRALCYEVVTNQKGLCARPRENAVGLFLFFQAFGLTAAASRGAGWRPA